MKQESKSINPLPDIVESLLAWYGRHARSMPWRDRPDPYRVWVSEIMLQQTRVETVIPYFERFVAVLPDLPALAAAEEETLLKLWEGLGYYSRVRNLAAAARKVVDEQDGQIPSEPAALERLPGIGPYTAGAIASIAFGVPAPAVDGNVLRVVSRLTADPADIRENAHRKNVAASLVSIIPPGRAGDFTQALMELGALVCVPGANPRCETCPLADCCRGYATGRPSAFPNRPARPPRRIETHTILVIQANDRYLIRKRPSKGLLANLWEFPHEPGALSKTLVERKVTVWGGRILSMEILPDARHVFSHLEWHLTGLHVRTDPFDPPDGMVWATAEALLETYAVPAAFAVYTDWIKSRSTE